MLKKRGENKKQMGKYLDIRRGEHIQTNGAPRPTFGVPAVLPRISEREVSGRSGYLRRKASFTTVLDRIVRITRLSRSAFLQSRLSEHLGVWQNRWIVFEYRLRVQWHTFSSRHRLFASGSPFSLVCKPARLSLVLAIFFGMGMTHMIEGVLNKSASADRDPVVAGEATEEKELSPEEIAALLEKGFEGSGLSGEVPFEVSLLSEFIEEDKQEKFEEEVRRLVKGYPIEEMLPYIFEKDRITATFLVGIGKKESNWGRRVPVLEGQDCYNYWGFREKRRLMGTGGHTCFNSRKDAVDSVAHRIEKLIFEYERDTPKEMIIWKCGYSCAGHSPESVRKWIADVEGYYKKLNEVGEE